MALNCRRSLRCIPRNLGRLPLASLHAGGSGGESIISIPVETKLPDRARVVIAGAGIVGNSVAYHMVNQPGGEWSDVVILDRGNVADGASKYGSGMLGMFRPAHERKIVQYCVDLYRSLQNKGFDIGFNECGSLNLANTKDRMISLRRRANRYAPSGLECHVLSPEECSERHPYLTIKDLQGGVWIPGDATVHPKKVSESLAFLAYSGGARFVGDCSVRKIVTRASNFLGPSSSRNVRICGVETDKGFIECEYFVNCAGIWARDVGKLSDPVVNVPVHPVEHFFLTFQPLPGLKDGEAESLPNVRDYDNHVYFRGWNKSLMMGAFERRGARPWDRENAMDEIHEEQWTHMAPYVTSACHRMEILKQVCFDFLLNTPDAFTPDGRWILGEAPEVGNYFVCAGMNGNSLQAAGGVGRVIAEWIAAGQAPGDMLPFELGRFARLHNTMMFLKDRVEEVVGWQYRLRYPLVNEFRTGRRIRTSPLFGELEARGAVFGERMGWERPLYFNQYHSRTDPPQTLPRGTFGRPGFFDHIEEEYFACRESVGVQDMSSFTKHVIKGQNAEAVVSYLQGLCVQDVDVPIGGIVFTGMLNENGGYENDCMLLRRGLSNYLMVSPTQQQRRILEWMENHLPKNNAVSLVDVTSMYAVLSVVGPKARALIEEFTGRDDLTNLPPKTFTNLDIGYASSVIICAVTQSGQPGYALYVLAEHAQHLYDRLMTIGHADFHIRNVGLLATRFLRIEKFSPFWGEEITAETTPIECGKQITRLKEDDFVGKSVLKSQIENGISRRLAMFTLNSYDKDVDPWPSNGEVIYRNGEFVGSVSNAAYGFTLKKMVCYGFVEHPNSIKGSERKILTSDWLDDKTAEWTIDIAGRKISAEMYLSAPEEGSSNVDVKAKELEAEKKKKLGQSKTKKVDIFQQK